MKTGEGEEGRKEESSEETYNVVNAGAFSGVFNVCMYVTFRSYEQDLLVTPTFLLDKNLECYYILICGSISIADIFPPSLNCFRHCSISIDRQREKERRRDR